MISSQTRLFIDGAWVKPQSSQTIPVISPVTEEEIATIPDGGTADIDAAVAAARTAFDSGPWPRMSHRERAEVLKRVADELDKRTDDMAEAMVAEMGSPITQAKFGQVPVTSELLRYYAENVDSYEWETRRPTYNALNDGFDVMVQQAPYGVVAAIPPWNGPQICGMMKYAPALLTGCTIVVKPSPEASLNYVGFAEAFEAAGIPNGVFNVVTGGVETSKYLVSHPDVDKVAFTGSVEVGRSIGEACATLMRPVTLELGGKSAAIIRDDADLDDAIERLLGQMFFVSGQACNAPSRILASANRYEEVVDAFVAAVDKLPLGLPTDADTVVGPMANQAQKERVQRYVEIGKGEGAKVALGGGVPDGFDKGWFVDKTVFRDVDNSMRIAQEEIFGPVLCIIKYEDDEDALRIANDSSLGLAGSVWTADVQKGYEMAGALRSGALGVNNHGFDPATPLAGRKNSGIGCERGLEAVYDYVTPRAILVPSEAEVTAPYII
ncbi:MAG: aldehyde dehydrogenase [Gordonia amarae]